MVADMEAIMVMAGGRGRRFVLIFMRVAVMVVVRGHIRLNEAGVLSGRRAQSQNREREHADKNGPCGRERGSGRHVSSGIRRCLRQG
ncbi:hypothetical protein [Mesorhizobium sp.]|uniref:hypothetical protein n=1 Tax=Mesorhizobium sp. TaxID=1871066 RepID=UPI000FE7FDD8|nr:hypothetical protein [Mesorhizobium sp.]RWI04645.1 MAG: hypothetical protein EOQ89_08670 [Mesorhizobium sp.]TJV33408.1 MAG: hypothetical protein E5X87_13180 [Mesorhizobium sp.]